MSEEQITMNKPEKTPARIAAGKRLSEYNKTMRDRQQSGKTPNVKDTEPIHGENNSEDVNNNGGMNLTRIIIFAGLSCLAYYMHTSNKCDDRNEEVKKDDTQQQEQFNAPSNNNVNKLRSFNN